MLNMIRYAFLKGLSDSKLRIEIVREIKSGNDASLRKTFMITKQTYEARVMMKKMNHEKF